MIGVYRRPKSTFRFPIGPCRAGGAQGIAFCAEQFILLNGKLVPRLRGSGRRGSLSSALGTSEPTRWLVRTRSLRKCRIVQNGFESVAQAEKFIEDFYLARLRGGLLFTLIHARANLRSRTRRGGT